MCKKFGRVCDHLVYDGKCEFAATGEDTTPTFAQMYQIYSSVANSSDLMKDRTLVALRGIAQLAGLPFDGRGELTPDEWELVYHRMCTLTIARVKDAAAALGIKADAEHEPTDEEWARIYARLREQEGGADAKGYDPATITYYFSRYRAAAGCTCKEIRCAYKKKGLVPPDCDFIPDVDYTGKRDLNEPLTYAQVKIIKDKMVELSKSPLIRDYNRYMRMFFGLYFGMRPCDIHRVTWDCIKKDPAKGCYLEYVPSKTERKTHGRPAGGPIHPALMSELEPLIRKHGEHVLVHRESMARGNNTKNRYVRNFKTLERWFSNFMRKVVGVKGFSTTYMCRKDCAQYNTAKHGPLFTVKLLGNSPQVLFTNYVRLEKLQLK